MKIYLVGGAVRDKLLNYPSFENDWVVVGGQPKDLLQLGYENVGKDFPVFLHPSTKEEYALARKERKVGRGYTGFEFDTSTTVSLEEDLSRRDLTINAIAQDENGALIDPYNGCSDIENKKLRHVSAAFAEDPVRVLRLARFAARYYHLGFTVADETIVLAQQMVNEGELDHLVAERVWKEFEKALGERHPDIFISVLRACGALKVIMPELDALFGVPQPEKHHPEIDTGEHSLMVLRQATLLSENKCVRFASLMHDLGKARTPTMDWPKHHGHEKLGLFALQTLSERIKEPNEYHDLAKLACEFHTHVHRAFELNSDTILKLFKQCDAYRRASRFFDFLLCCKADAKGRLHFEGCNYPQANYLAQAFLMVQNINAQPFIAQGLKGKEIGEAIKQARLAILKPFTASIKTSLTDIRTQQQD